MDILKIDAVTGARTSYGEIVEMTKKLAVSFTRIGVRKGQCIAICSATNRPDLIATVLATCYVGAVHTYIYPEGTATIAQRMRSVQPDVIICSPKAYQNYKTLLQQPFVKTFIVYGDENLGASYTFKELLKGEGRNVKPAKINGLVDLAIIEYSSGTTGPSKSIPMTHFQWITATNRTLDPSYYKDKTVLVSHFLPLWLASLHAGATTVFVDGEPVKDIIGAAEKYQVDVIQEMSNTMTNVVRSPLLAAADLSSVQRILCYASPLSSQLVKEIRDKIPSVSAVCQIYGSTEAAAITSTEIGPRPHSIGKALPGMVIKVVDLKTGELLGPNERGEIRIKSAAPIPAYLGMSSTDHTDSEGFYKTGDMGYYDEDHYFYLVDRIKDIIKCNGYAVAPQDLEEIITSHKEVLEAAVVGAPHERYHEVPVAFVVPRAGSKLTAGDVTKLVNEQVPYWMQLAGPAGGAIFLNELPRGTRGKIDRKALRKLVLAM